MREAEQQAKINNPATRARYESKRLELRPAAQGLNTLEKEWRKPLFVLLAMVLLLLLIACANLANLLLARAVNRTREIAIRFALGAGRWRVVRLLLTESALLAVAGTACGIALAPLLAGALIRLMPGAHLRQWLTGAINAPLLAFSVGLMIAAALLFGLLPALQATRGQASPLGERTQGSSGGGMNAMPRKAIVAAQIALSLVLLCTAGLFGRSLANLMRHQPGFRAEHLLTFSVDAGLGGYDTIRGLNLYRDLNHKLKALPGVESTSLAFTGPLLHSHSISNVMVDGYTPRNDDEMMCDTNAAGPGYFHTIGTPVLAGREFDERDTAAGPKVAVVNQAFVKRFIGNRFAVGRKMSVGSGVKLDIEIVGVVADANTLNLRDPIAPMYFVPYDQAMRPGPRALRAQFFVRASEGVEGLAGAIRGAMAQLDRSLPVYGLEAMEVNLEDSIYTDRLVAALSTAFGVLALLLTAVGLYGVIGYLVSRRTAEIGIRMVLGAAPGGIVRMILGEVGLLIVAGGAAGIAGAIAAGRAVASQLFGMRGLDVGVLAGATAVLAAVAITAAALPAIRAARIQPLDALRHE